jgi:hypothetical protein
MMRARLRALFTERAFLLLLSLAIATVLWSFVRAAGR